MRKSTTGAAARTRQYRQKRYTTGGAAGTAKKTTRSNTNRQLTCPYKRTCPYAQKPATGTPTGTNARTSPDMDMNTGTTR